MPVAVGDTQRCCVRMAIDGTVQGVGFRPFVYRLATELGLTGWVCNSTQGVLLEVEGDVAALQHFQQRLTTEKPRQAAIHRLQSAYIGSQGYTTFSIRQSQAGGNTTALVLPDIATCADCRHELFDPHDRHYLYPFINCTACGPRFSIVEALPYDRVHTTMRHFVMCRQCQAEYDDPHSRRFHAQPNACPQCGPSLAFWDRDGRVLASAHAALLEAVTALQRGAIVAVKGLGGFHLMVVAENTEAVQRLRQRKHREEKPFALMYPSLQAVQHHCHVSALEADVLQSSEAPIVLLRRQSRLPHCRIAPENPYLGVMLPYTPLHALLLHLLGCPVVATSGNQADEPLCTYEAEALIRLRGIADAFLVHNRPIARHVDDSIVRIMLGRVQVLRRARGFTPLPIHWDETPQDSTRPKTVVLAVGAHLKNTIAMAVGPEIFVSQHIGDLETVQAFDTFQQTIAQWPHLYRVTPATVACDAHPDYLSTRGAMAYGTSLRRVQHHYAHVLACMADNELHAPLLGVAWDGSGYGLDGTLWGGEFLQVSDTSFQRLAHFRPFPLPGGERAIREPRRAAIGLLHSLYGASLVAMSEVAPVHAFTPHELRVLCTMLEKQINTPLTSSVGRLFDAVAALLDLRQSTTFEGQAAMQLEFTLDSSSTEAIYPFRIDDQGTPWVIDWAPLIQALLADLQRQVGVGHIAAIFHNTLVEIIVAVAQRHATKQVVLTGGCFHNRYLTEQAVRRLRAEGFHPFWHQRVPPNDGGIALGQVLAVLRAQR